MNLTKTDRVGELLTDHLKEMLFDELSEDYLKRAEVFDILDGVPVPIRKIELDKITVLNIALNMAFVLGCTPSFKYSENYIKYILRNFDKKFAEGLIAQGVDYAQKGQLDNALISFRGAILIDADNANAYYCYGRALKDSYEMVAHASESEGCDLRNMSAAEDIIGRYKAESIEAFEAASTLDPELAEAYYFLGYAYLNMGLYVKAKLTWERYISLMEDRGVSTLSGKQNNEIKETLSEIKERFEQLREPVKIEEGCNLVLTGKFEEGIKVLKPYTESRFNEWWPLWYYLATAYRELAKISEREFAEAEPQKEIKEDELTKTAYEQAASYYKQVLKLSPSNRDAMKELAEIYEKLGDTVMRDKYLKKIEIVSNNAEKDRDMLRRRDEQKLN